MTFLEVPFKYYGLLISHRIALPLYLMFCLKWFVPDDQQYQQPLLTMSQRKRITDALSLNQDKRYHVSLQMGSQICTAVCYLPHPFHPLPTNSRISQHPSSRLWHQHTVLFFKYGWSVHFAWLDLWLLRRTVLAACQAAPEGKPLIQSDKPKLRTIEHTA